MRDFIFFMHNDTPAGSAANNDTAWQTYFTMLRASGRFDGGSSIGGGVCVSNTTPVKAISSHLTGYIRVRAESLDDAKVLLKGNPVLDSGGTVEVRELPRG